MKYIEAGKLKYEIKRRKLSNYYTDTDDYETELFEIIDSLQQEQPEVDLEKFTEKMDAWKARYNYPDNIPIKGTMAFTARMFYMYPEVAREWYDSLPKVTLD
jgi:hypothetical protein